MYKFSCFFFFYQYIYNSNNSHNVYNFFLNLILLLYHINLTFLNYNHLHGKDQFHRIFPSTSHVLT